MNFTIRIANYRVSLLNVITCVGSLLFILAFFSSLYDRDIDLFLSSDCLYLPSLYKDVFIDGNNLKDWHLNPAPNFFPDMGLYFGLMFLCRNAFVVCSFIFSIIQYLAILYLLSRLFRELFPNRSRHWYSVIFLLLSAFLMEYQFFTKEYYYSFYIISNSFHTGSFVMTLLCLLWSVKYYRAPSYRLLAYILVTGILCVASDRLFIILYCIPVFVSGLFLIKKTAIKYILLHSLTIGMLVLLGMTAFNTFGGGNYFTTDNPHKIIAFEDIGNSFSIFSEQMLIYLGEFGFKAISIYLFLLSFFGMIVLFFKTGKLKEPLIRFYAVFSIVFSVVVIATPVINGSYTGYDTLRYNIYPFYLAAINIPVLLCYLVKREKIVTAGKYVTAACSVLFLIFGVASVKVNGLQNYFSYYPEKVRALDELAEKNGLTYGVGNYWEAKQTTMFSKKGIKIYAVFEDLALYEHVANHHWFYDNTFNFVLLNRFQDTSRFKNSILNYKRIENADGLMLVRTNTFTYQKDKGYLPINN